MPALEEDKAQEMPDMVCVREETWQESWPSGNEYGLEGRRGDCP